MMTTGTPPPIAHRRSRARLPVPLGIAVWLVLEIWLLTLVADVAGGLTVLLLLLGAVVLGSTVIKRAGRRAFRDLIEALQQQPGAEPAASPCAPDRESSGNGFLMLGGLLIMLPGLISDVFGLLCLIPPVRSLLSRYTERSVERRTKRAVPGSLGDAFQQARMRRPDGKVVQGEVIKEEPEPRERHKKEGPRPPLAP
jgi:UPF0716 protein FxsA